MIVTADESLRADDEEVRSYRVPLPTPLCRRELRRGAVYKHTEYRPIDTPHDPLHEPVGEAEFD